MHRSTELANTNLQISVGRHVSAAASDYAREKIGAALEYAGAPVLSARVRLEGHADPAVTDPTVAQANVNVDGRAVRAQVSAASAREAIDLLAARLRGRLERMSRRWEPVRGNRFGPDPHVWHHGATPRPRLPYFPRPIEEREILRRKSFALASQTCDEAANDMALLDYEFHLFTEAGSGLDSVLYRTGQTSYRLAQLDPDPDAVIDGVVAITASPTPPPALSAEGAAERLELTGWPFVFFVDPELNRGCVLYHRYDGHYGLITPVSTAA